MSDVASELVLLLPLNVFYCPLQLIYTPIGPLQSREKHQSLNFKLSHSLGKHHDWSQLPIECPGSSLGPRLMSSQSGSVGELEIYSL
jgi:hypothetical protein